MGEEVKEQPDCWFWLQHD